MINDLSYFQRRAVQEQAAALRASHPRAKRAHSVMAQKYEDRVRRFPAGVRSLPTISEILVTASSREKVHGDECQ